MCVASFECTSLVLSECFVHAHACVLFKLSGSPSVPMLRAEITMPFSNKMVGMHVHFHTTKRQVRLILLSDARGGFLPTSGSLMVSSLAWLTDLLLLRQPYLVVVKCCGGVAAG